MIRCCPNVISAVFASWCCCVSQEVLREIALLIPEIQLEVTLLGPGMADHPSGWITHEGLTVNGRKGLYHDLLPQPTLQNENQDTAVGSETTAREAEPEPQEEGTRKHHSKKNKNKQKTVILSSAGVGMHEHLLSPPVRHLCCIATVLT